MPTRPTFSSVVFAGAAVLSMGGCQTATPFPPVTPALAAAAHGTPPAVLSEGRRLVAYRCTDCHQAHPASEYSPEDWVDELASMAPRAKLTPTEKSAVLAYLSAASVASRSPGNP